MKGMTRGSTRRKCVKNQMVPRVGIEPTLLSERDFESRASTNFTTEAGVQTRCRRAMIMA